MHALEQNLDQIFIIFLFIILEKNCNEQKYKKFIIATLSELNHVLQMFIIIWRRVRDWNTTMQ